jgi:endoglycosylceramidase
MEMAAWRPIVGRRTVAGLRAAVLGGGLVALLTGTPAVLGRGVAAPASAVAPQQLHVSGTTLRDGLGRQVILRGIAVINKDPPYLPPVGPADFARIRSWGMNSIRLGILWAGIMPSPGVIDTSYVSQIATLVDEAAQTGLYVVLDMHQDLWGAAYGGDGAPAWTDPTAPYCPYVNWEAETGQWAANYFSPAVGCAFYDFWTEPGLQAYYVQAWQAVAAAVAGQPMVAGFDFMNEPFSGPIPPGAFETEYLYPAEFSWLAAIRTVDPGAIGFVEPPNTKNADLPTVPATWVPPGVVYAPHLYGLWGDDQPTTDTLRPLAAENFDYSRAEAAAMAVPLWLGEFDGSSTDPGESAYVTSVYDMADQAMAGASWWAYDSSVLGANGANGPLVDAVARPYPWAVTGTLESISYNTTTHVLTVAWDQDTDGTSVFSTPAEAYPEGVSVGGATSWSYDPTTATVTVTAGPGSHQVEIAPAA